MLDDTYGMHVQTNALLELPPSQFVAWDLGSFVSDQSQEKFRVKRKEKKKKRIIGTDGDKNIGLKFL